MKILVWNCRGAGSADTSRAIIRLVRDHSPHILVLTETRVPSTRAKNIIKRTQFTNIAAVEARGFAGGIWCLWDDTTIKVKVLSYTAQILNIGIMSNATLSWVASFVYASPVEQIRESLYTYIEEMSRFISMPWMLIGDFNQVMYQEDKKGGRPVGGPSTERMQHLIDICALMDLPYTGPRFTWSNGQEGRFRIEQRLDQAWANSDWIIHFSTASLIHLPRTHSDHSPLLLKVNDTDHFRSDQKPPFKFQACWMEHKAFETFMQTAWQEYQGEFSRTVSEFTEKMKKWSVEVFGNLQQRRKRCLARLYGIQRTLEYHQSTFLSKLHKDLTEEYNSILEQEEIYWQQKNNLAWIASGEQNSRFFHQCIAAKRRTQRITCLQDEEGTHITCPTRLETMISDHYKKLFACTSPDTEIIDEDITIRAFNATDQAWLNRPISEQEIDTAIFQMGAYKAPGPDGIPPIFYQKNWQIVGPSVKKFVLEAFSAGQFPAELNATLVMLIPKVPMPTSTTQFRPIALTNVVVKVISKIIANRLKPIIGQIISHTQCAFIPNRQASDNIIIAQEIMHTMRMKQGRKGYMSLKLDLEKAYDKVYWPFLKLVLHKVGFSNHMVQLIMYMISSASLSLIWNGRCLDPFHPQRGIRQGDPLAPYLFLMCMEVLSGKIEKAVDSRRWRPIPTSRSGPLISHLFFADDLLLFAEATTSQTQVIESIIRDFCRISGQSVSIHKSQILVSKNIITTFDPGIITQLGIQRTTDLGNYLGMPLIHGRSGRKTYKFLIDKVRIKLGAWQTKLLSQAARCILICSVLNSIPTYAMQTVRLPAGLLQEIDKLARKFFWGEIGGGRRLHWCSWELICKPKSQGGLGIKKLSHMNLAMLSKLAWNIITRQDLLWVRVLRSKYGDLLHGHSSRNTSKLWKHIQSTLPIILEGLEGSANQVDGNNTQPRWKPTDSGKFEVRSAYKLSMKTPTIPQPRWENIWAMRGPGRHNMLLWQICHNALPTRTFLRQRHIDMNTECMACRQQEDDTLHVLRDCSWTKQIWNHHLAPPVWPEFILPNTPIEWVMKNLESSWGRPTSTWEWRYVFRETVSSIWYWRNQLIHDSVERLPPPIQVYREIVSRIQKQDFVNNYRHRSVVNSVSNLDI